MAAKEILRTVGDTLNADNNLRKAAEREYEKAKESNPTGLVSGFFNVLNETQADVTLREQSAVLLRKCLEQTTEASSVWNRLGETGQTHVKQCLLQALETEENPKVRRKIADCTQSLGNQIIDLQGADRPNNVAVWPELMPTLMRIVCDASKDAAARADCIWALSEMCLVVWKVLVANPTRIHQVLSGCLADPSPVIQAESVTLLCNFAENIESRVERKPFVPLVPEVLSKLAQLAKLPEPKLLNQVLTSLQSTCEMADFFKDHVASFIAFLGQVAEGHPDDESKKLALEALLSLAESKPKMVSKVPDFWNLVLKVCLKFLLQLDDDVQSWVEAEPESGDFDEDVHTCGKEALDRIARVADGIEIFPVFLEILKPMLTELFQNGRWKEVIAGVVAMRQIAEFIADDAVVEQMLGGIKAQLAACHVRVRYAAWGGLAQFAQDHEETTASFASSNGLLDEFLKALDDECGRVSVRSMEAFSYFSEWDREELEPYVQAFMEKLGVKLQAGPMFQKKAITYIACIAMQVEEQLAPYYGTLMPLLMHVAQNALHKVEERTLIAKCFECISILARVAGRERFRTDAKIIMESMVQATQVPDLPENDPVKEYVMKAAERISSIMQEEFVPFVPAVLPMIIEKLSLSPREFNVQNVSDISQNLNLTFTEENGVRKVMMMYSSEMEDKRSALECINTFVQKLGRHYAQFVAETARQMLPVFEFQMGEEIRDLCYDTWAELIGCAHQDGQSNVVSELVMQFLKRIVPKMTEGQEIDVEALKTRADGITTCLKKAGKGVLSEEEIQHLSQVCLQLVGESLQRRAQYMQEKAAKAVARKVVAQEDDDDDDDNGDEVQEKMESTLRVSLLEVAGAIMQHHPDQFMNQGFQKYFGLVTKLMEAKSCTEDQKLAAYVTVDFIEHLGSRAASHWPQLINILLEDVSHEDSELRQPACYGLSMAAKGQAFSGVATTAAPALAKVITDARGRTKSSKDKLRQACADNALSAIMEMLVNHSPALGDLQVQLWDVWLAGMPCQEDEEESVRNNAFLLKMLAQERPEVIGKDGANVPRLLGVLLGHYKTDFADDEINAGIRQLVVRLGEAKLEQIATSFTDKQRRKLVRAVKDAQK